MKICRLNQFENLNQKKVSKSFIFLSRNALLSQGLLNDDFFPIIFFSKLMIQHFFFVKYLTSSVTLGGNPIKQILKSQI
jgi:hypothetical protein